MSQCFKPKAATLIRGDLHFSINLSYMQLVFSPFFDIFIMHQSIFERGVLKEKKTRGNPEGGACCLKIRYMAEKNYNEVHIQRRRSMIRSLEVKTIDFPGFIYINEVWLKLAQWFRKIFLHFVHLFSLFRNYLNLKKGVALCLNKLNFSVTHEYFVPSF